MITATEFNALDLTALGLIFVELLLGMRRGMSGEFFRFLGSGAVLLAALKFYRPLGLWLVDHSRMADNPAMATALGFTLLTLGGEAVLLGLRLLLNLLMKITFNEKIDRPGGAMIGMFRGLLLVIMLVFAGGLWPQDFMQSFFVQQSMVGRTIFEYAHAAVDKLDRTPVREVPALMEQPLDAALPRAHATPEAPDSTPAPKPASKPKAKATTVTTPHPMHNPKKI